MALFHVGDGSFRGHRGDGWRPPSRAGSIRKTSTEHRVVFKSVDQVGLSFAGHEAEVTCFRKIS